MKEVLLLRSSEYASTPALPRFAAVLSELRGHAAVAALCWRTNSRFSTPPSISDRISVRHFERPADSRTLGGVAGLAAWWLCIARELCRSRYRLVQASDVFALLPCALMRPLLRYKLVADVRDHMASIAGTHWGVKATVLGWLEGVLLRAADAVIVVDETRRELLPGSLRRSDKVTVVRNVPQVDAGAAPCRDGDQVHVNFSGYLSMIRGAAPLIEAVTRDARSYLEVVGETNDRDLAERLANGQRVMQHGRVSHADATWRMAEADIVALLYDPAVVANRYAAPNKFYEAMMIGRPVLVAAGTPMEQWVNENRCGYVVNYGSVDELCAVFEQIRRDRAGWRRRCERARAFYERELRWDREASRIKETYLALLSEET